MSHFGDFLEGVTVKISEKYKRPPKIELPYSVAESTARAQHLVDNTNLSFTFEKNVLTKIKELRNAKETKKNEKRHRLQLMEEAKQKKLDAIAAAEAEEKLKQLSVSDVSYPSTDEISELSPDKQDNCDITLTQDAKKESPGEQENHSTAYPSSSKEPESNILQPIPVQCNVNSNCLLDDPDPLQEYRIQSHVPKKPPFVFSNHNIETMTYKDFENDTSSPFDNVELKTLNDMEQLAQVLQSQRDSSMSCQQFIPEQGYANVPNCASQAQLEGITYLSNAYMEQPIQGHSMMYTQPQYINNGYYMAENMPLENVYMPNYQYYVPTNPYPEPVYYPQPEPMANISQIPSDAGYGPQPYFYNNYPYQYPQQNFYNPNATNNIIVNSPSTSTNSIKSRSRSVPDIVRELNEEIEQAKRRVTERSYNPSPAPKEQSSKPSSSREVTKKKTRRKSEQLPNPIEKLSPELQEMCRRVHGMGFPLERVARVCTLVGDNDKKIVEGLLLMGELMDLGFSESKVSAALAKHEFNRDKALDELVS